jgi:hypothetical protein
MVVPHQTASQRAALLANADSFAKFCLAPPHDRIDEARLAVRFGNEIGHGHGIIAFSLEKGIDNKQVVFVRTEPCSASAGAQATAATL